MADDGTIRKDDIISPEVSPAIDALKNQFKDLNENAAIFAQTLKLFPADFANSVKSMSDLNKATADQDLQTQKVEAATKKLIEAQKEITAETIKAKESQKQLNEEAKLRAIIEDQNTGTLKRAEAQVKLNTLAIRNMNLEQKGAKDKVKELNDEINKNNAIIKENSDQLKQQKINVGNYTESINNATFNLGEMRKELLLLKNTSFAGKTSEEIQEINKRMGELMHQMKESKAAVTNLGKDGFQLMTGSAKFFAAGIETVVGALSAIGVESPILEKLKGNITQLIAVTHGLAEIEEVLKTKTLQATAARLGETAATVYNTVARWTGVAALQATIAAKEEDVAATAVEEGATVGLTAAQWLYNAALYACPIVIIILAVAALATGVYFLVKALKSGGDETEALTDHINELKKAAAETDAFNKFALDLMNAYGMAETAIIKAKINAAKQTIISNDAIMASEQALMKMKIANGEMSMKEYEKEYAEYKKYADTTSEIKKGLIIQEIELNKATQKENDERMQKIDDQNKIALQENVRLLEAKHAKDYEAGQQELKDHIKVIEAKRELDLYDAKLPGEIAKINADADREIYESKKKYADEEIKLQEQKQKELDALLKESEKDLEDAHKEEVKKSSEKYKLLEEQFKTEEAKESEIAKTAKIKDIQNYEDFLMSMLEIKIRFLKQELDEGLISKEQYNIELEKIKQEEIKIEKNTDAQILAAKKKNIEEQKKLQKDIFDVSKAIENSLTNIIDGYYSMRLNNSKIAEEKELSNKNLSAKQKAAIEKKYAHEAAVLKHQQAVIDKDMSITKATINMAESLIEAWTLGPIAGGIMAGIIADFDAVQIGLLVSTQIPPVPSFKKGVKDFQGGAAQVHGGEIIALPTGEKFMTTGGVDEPINTYLPKHSSVIPNEIVREQILNMPKSSNNDEIIMQNKLLSDILKATSKDKKGTIINFDPNGFTIGSSEHNSYVKRIGKFRGIV